MAAVIITGVVFIGANSQMEKVSRKETKTAVLVKGITELEILTYDYLLHHEKRSEEQWKMRYDSLQNSLLSGEFKEPAELAVLERVNNNLKGIKYNFSQLTEGYRNGQDRLSNKTTIELQERLISQMMLSSREAVSDSFKLNELTHRERENVRQKSNMLTGFLISVLAVVITSISFLINRTISEPLRKLREGTEVVGSGNLAYRINMDTKDEIGQLSRSFDQMTERLKRVSVSRDELVKENIKRRQMGNALKAANRELEAFSYSVSHDLRAPLRSIDGFSRALLEDYLDRLDEKGKDYLNRVCRASQRMGQLIDDMLILSRVVRAEMHYEEVDLSAMAREISSNLGNSRSEHRVEFIIQEGLTATGDARLLKMAMENLLGNAWKFTEKHSSAKIEFGAKRENGKQVFFVRDDGAGFDMAYVNKLFQPFQRLHELAEFSGTGVGLANVKRIIQRHGGDIWAEGAIERGAAFYFSI